MPLTESVLHVPRISAKALPIKIAFGERFPIIAGKINPKLIELIDRGYNMFGLTRGSF